MAKSKLQNIGYNSTSAILTTQFKTDVPSRLKYAFYSCSHGNETLISSKKNEEDENRIFFARNVPEGTYKFVFLDACNTASNTWKNAFGISNSSTNKVFLGWAESVSTTASYEFCELFWAKISSDNTVYNAAMDAAREQGDDLLIEFTGDDDYNGYY